MSPTLEQSAGLLERFKELKDPRAEHLLEHYLLDIVGLTIWAVICGADSWLDIENYGQAKLEWLKRFLKLPNGIPRHHRKIVCCSRARETPRMFSELDKGSSATDGGSNRGNRR